MWKRCASMWNQIWFICDQYGNDHFPCVKDLSTKNLVGTARYLFGS